MECIGLFGTCDNHRWRDPFMARYEELGINYFNPMVDDWHPGLVEQEARHLAEDDVVLFPVLGWSYGVASLSEIGFGPLKAYRQNKEREFIVYIETELHERLDDPARCKDSRNARKIVLGHLQSLKAPNVHIVNSLDDMLGLSVELYLIQSRKHKALQEFVKTA